jgi:hypothetical protein
LNSTNGGYGFAIALVIIVCIGLAVWLLIILKRTKEFAKKVNDLKAEISNTEKSI